MKLLKSALVLLYLAGHSASAAIYDVDLDLLNITSMSVSRSGVLGAGWETECAQSIFGTCLAWDVVPTTEHSVSVQLKNGWIDVFDVGDQTSYADPTGLAQGHLTFIPGPDTLGSLVALGSGFYDFLFGGELLDLNFEVVDPDRFLYTNSDGGMFYLSRSEGLYQATDINGDSLIFDGDILMFTSHGAAAGDFVRDKNGLLFEIGSSVLIPIPAAAWLFGFGLIGLIGVARRKQ